ncbi:MAG: deoxyribodipyrimidine photo-lyase, partial [Steroidobacteraceae bacterium]
MTTQRPIALVWFRQDLRLADNPSLRAALASGASIVPVYVWAPGDEGEWGAGAASRWWVHHSLTALDVSLRALGSRLVLRRGSALKVLPELAANIGASALFWNRRYEPAAIEIGTQLKSTLRERGVTVHSCKSALLAEPWEIRTGSGGSYRLFTPYRNTFLKQIDPPLPQSAPSQLPAPPKWPASLELASLELLPGIAWDKGLADSWTPGEAGAQMRLRELPQRLPAYRDARDVPATPGTSRLSPHLHFGEVSPAQVWHAVGSAEQARGLPRSEWRHSKFLAELIWREFAAQALYHAPTLPTQPFQAQFAKLKWRESPDDLGAWQQGRTGVDIVDAGMRELWETGWMHNRMRMICASFLVKNLLVPWQHGARWFWDTLVDADLANNSLNWQWIAGSGPDAAPWFRVFNPLRQAERFDPDGAYQARWTRRAAALLPPFDAERSRTGALEAYRE